MATVLAGACVRQRSRSRVGQAQRIIHLAVGQQPAVGGDRGAAELQQQTTIEIEPQSALICFTRRVPYFRPIPRLIPRKLMNFNPEPPQGA